MLSTHTAGHHFKETSLGIFHKTPLTFKRLNATRDIKFPFSFRDDTSTQALEQFSSAMKLSQQTSNARQAYIFKLFSSTS